MCFSNYFFFKALFGLYEALKSLQRGGVGLVRIVLMPFLGGMGSCNLWCFVVGQVTHAWPALTSYIVKQNNYGRPHSPHVASANQTNSAGTTPNLVNV